MTTTAIGSPLNRDMILEHIASENISIRPFDLSNLGTVSYDVRLGDYFFRGDAFGKSSARPLNPFNPLDVTGYWGNPKEGEVAGDWMKEHGDLANIKADDKIIILEPREMILAHTQEFIGGRNYITTLMSARSSMGRMGITVCSCANFGDPGFCNRWSMEICNHLKMPVVLVTGMRVAQIHFYSIDPLSLTYIQNGGQYQKTDDVDTLVKDWSPRSILPKFNRKTY